MMENKRLRVFTTPSHHDDHQRRGHESMRSVFKLVIVLAILAGGIFTAKWLIATKPKAERKSVSVGAPVVAVTPAVLTSPRVNISAMGTVVPNRKIEVVPRVSGHVVFVAPEMIAGGRFSEGEVMFRLDDADYRIAVDRQEAEVARAMMELKQERGRSAIAEREWKLLSRDVRSSEEGRELILRIPQMKNAEAVLASAKSALKKAKLDVARTIIRAPFNALVLEKSADAGQYVAPGSRLATLVGTDAFQVVVSAPVDRIANIAIPGVNAPVGAEAVVVQDIGSGKITRRGRVIRLMGDLDPEGRMARIIVSIADPLNLQKTDAAPGLPLLLDAYVRVSIAGPRLENVVEIPREVLQEEEIVFLMTGENRLEIRPVDIVWRSREVFFVRGISAGEQIVVSRLSAPVAGMKLKPAPKTGLQAGKTG
jgi:RND family efflux transporter MFP subunit